MGKALDLSGRRFGRLTILGRAGSDERGQALWHCKCDCGNASIVTSSNLRRGNSTSCGCFRNEKTSQRRKAHGQTKTRLYTIWENMKKRCLKPSQPHFDDYGGRGITVCAEWLNCFEDFRDWAFANGYADNLSIDRIDVNGNYCPENCRWVDVQTQMNNTRRNNFITFNGETHTLAEWSRLTGINYMSLKTRLQRGWSIEKALTEPIKKGR